MMKLGASAAAVLAASSSVSVSAMYAEPYELSPSAVASEIPHLKDPPMFAELPGTAVAVRASALRAVAELPGTAITERPGSHSRGSSVAGSAAGDYSNVLDLKAAATPLKSKKGPPGTISSQDGTQRYVKVLSAKETDTGGFARA